MHEILTAQEIIDQILSTQEYPQAPDNDAILAATVNSASPYYYPALFMRYTSGDMSLTLEDFRHLYYGYAYRPNYRPLESVASNDRILMILEANANPTAEDCQNIIAQAEEVLRYEPFNPGTLNFLTYAYGLLGDTINEQKSAYKMDMVLRTIASSGTGLTEDSPWHVLYTSHSLDFCAWLEQIMYKRIIISRTVEFISLSKPEGRLKGYYFDYGRVYWNKPETYKGQISNGLQLNGVTTIKERK